jgi:hypothetical protein
MTKNEPMIGGPAPSPAPWTQRLALIGVALSLATVAFIMAVNVVFLVHGQVGSILFSGIPTLLILDMSLVGGLLTIRRPGNAIGPILLIAGLLIAVTFASGYYLNLDAFAGDLPFVVPVAWVSDWTILPAIGLMIVFLPLLFPTGHLPGPRWRILARVAVVAIILGTIQAATTPGLLTNAGSIVNPVQVPEPILDWITAAGVVSNLIAPPAFLLALASVIVRFRRARGVEREQLKWFLFVASIAAASLGLSIVSTGPISDIGWVVGLLAMGCLPLAIGIAIMRYRLYEIDRVASRTLSYAVVTTVLVAVFAGLNLALEALLASLTQAGTLAVAASTLAVFALFQPLRRRVQSIVDHRFDRERYEADRIMSAFAGRLRDQVDTDRVRLDIDRVLAQTVAPSSTGLWLRGEGAITHDRAS